MQAAPGQVFDLVTARTVKFLGRREGNGGPASAGPIGEPPPGGEDDDLLLLQVLKAPLQLNSASQASRPRRKSSLWSTPGARLQ